jgi:hypothetical protein
VNCAQAVRAPGRLAPPPPRRGIFKVGVFYGWNCAVEAQDVVPVGSTSFHVTKEKIKDKNKLGSPARGAGRSPYFIESKGHIFTLDSRSRREACIATCGCCTLPDRRYGSMVHILGRSVDRKGAGRRPPNVTFCVTVTRCGGWQQNFVLHYPRGVMIKSYS